MNPGIRFRTASRVSACSGVVVVRTALGGALMSSRAVQGAISAVGRPPRAGSSKAEAGGSKIEAGGSKAEAGGSKSDAGGSETDKNLFRSSLESLGFEFTDPGRAVHACERPERVAMNLNRALIGDEASAAEFMSGFEALVEDDSRFAKSLRCTAALDAGASVVGRAATQSSLVRILLNVGVIQERVLAVLLEKLPECAASGVGGGGGGLARAIIRQMRWLDSVVDGNALSEKLCEVLAVCPVPVQRELIAAVPDIVDDSGRDMVVDALASLMTDVPALTVPILDAFSNLTLREDVAVTVTDTVIAGLVSTSFEDLPVVIRFALRTTPPKRLQGAVARLRRNLNFFGRSGGGGGAAVRRGKGTRNEPTLLIDALKSAIRLQRAVAVAFLKEIARLEAGVEHKVLDFWLLLVVHSVSSMRRRAAAVMRKKVAAGLFSPRLIGRAVRGQPAVARSLSSSLLAVAGDFVRGAGVRVVTVGGLIYGAMFESVRDPSLRQEIVGQLLTHIGSGAPQEAGAGIAQLLQLAEGDPAALQPYVAFVRGLLDHMRGFSATQTRAVFRVFSILATARTARCSGFGNELRIFIRKQLANPKGQYLGAVGAISLLAELAPRSDVALPRERLDEAVSLLQSVFKSASTDHELRALIADEFAHVIGAGRLHNALVEHVLNYAAERFENDYLADIQGDGDVDAKTGCHYWMGLNGDEGSMAIKVLPALRGTSPPGCALCLAPIFRLLQVCEGRQNKGSRAGINALLGAPLMLFDPDDEGADDAGVLEPKEQDERASALFYAVQWVRELLNAFAGQPDPEMHSKLCQRVGHLVELEERLRETLKQLGERAGGDFTPIGAPVALQQEAEHDGAGAVDGGSKLFPAKRRKKQLGRGAAGKDAASALAWLRDNHYRSLFPSSFLAIGLPLHLSGPSSDESSDDDVKHSSSVAALRPKHIRYLFSELESLLASSLRPERKAPPGGLSRSTRGATSQAAGPRLRGHAARDPTSLLREVGPVLPSVARHAEAISAALAEEDADCKYDTQQLRDALMHAMACVRRVVARADTLAGEPIFWQSLSALTMARATPPKPVPTRPAPPLSQKRPAAEVKKDVAWDVAGPSQDEKLLVCKGAYGFLERICKALAAFPDKVAAIDAMQLTIACAPVRYDALRVKISDLARSLLTTRWGDDTKLNTSTVGKTLRVYIAYAEEPLAVIEDLVATAFSDVSARKSRKRRKKGGRGGSGSKRAKTVVAADKENAGQDNDANGETDGGEGGNMELAEASGSEGSQESDAAIGGCPFHATLRAPTLRFYYAVAVEELSRSVAGVRGVKSPSSQVSLYARHANAFRQLSGLCKKYHGNSQLLAATLRSGRPFLEAYVRQMAFFQQHFSEYRPTVIQMIKNIQQGTRVMQMICTHGKRTRSVSLIGLVPASKKVMETFIYQVKKLFKNNDCLRAFWQGNLKHRAMDGREIVATQSSQENGESTDSDDCRGGSGKGVRGEPEAMQEAGSDCEATV